MEQMCDEALGVRCLEILTREIGPVDTERFVAYVSREHFDYTEWQRNLFAGQSIDEIAQAARQAGDRVRMESRAQPALAPL